MPDLLKVFIVCCIVVFFFWFIKAYYVFRSNYWAEVEGRILNIYPVTGGDAEGFAVTVEYSYNNIAFTKDALDTGALDIRDKALIGRKILVLVDPETPTKFVIKNLGTDLFNASAIYAARVVRTIRQILK
ncbi:DUF3592 domain-containing protein [Phyllobacterium myrsinacearum]|uniref:DUF3592 domain-containing protein n=1 Tax=Phyllobacterium myrsinacearum TaxID=28101 RepID=A0A839ESW8_9HYPH|nr:DUF3592 domain-containing protein [Phyllobacterium myrsinacearum]MBA8881205.1 hypothetical protein [Phyllobacterium myrsinacearum]